MHATSKIRSWSGVRSASLIAGALILGVGLAGAASAAPAEKAVAPEQNPPGDIPDNQVFITYASPDGYDIKVPEGWARTVSGHAVKFTDKYGVITVDEAAAAQAPTVASVQGNEVPALKGTGRAVDVKSVAAATLKGGQAIRIVYQSNSDPNAVTGKQIRQEHERYILFANGKLATVDFAAPAGADNVDQWKLMSDSFRWK